VQPDNCRSNIAEKSEEKQGLSTPHFRARKSTLPA
jgi:hypothetical protein